MRIMWFPIYIIHPVTISIHFGMGIQIRIQLKRSFQITKFHFPAIRSHNSGQVPRSRRRISFSLKSKSFRIFFTVCIIGKILNLSKIIYITVSHFDTKSIHDSIIRKRSIIDLDFARREISIIYMNFVTRA